MFSSLQVYGSNDMTLDDVLNFYSFNLRANGWTEGSSGSNWRSFWLGGKEFVLSVSDDTDLEWEDLMYHDGSFNANRAKVDDARKRFKTIYVLSLTGYDLNPTAKQQCQEF